MKIRKKKKPKKYIAVQVRPKRAMSAVENKGDPFKIGDARSAAGRPAGSISIKRYLRKLLAGPAYDGDSENLADELAKVMIEHCRAGDFKFMTLVVGLTESRALTNDEMLREVDRIFRAIVRNVHDEDTLTKIATELYANFPQYHELTSNGEPF